jgi:hypothetical protein
MSSRCNSIANDRSQRAPRAQSAILMDHMAAQAEAMIRLVGIEQEQRFWVATNTFIGIDETFAFGWMC